MTDLTWMPIADLAENIRKKRVSPVEAVQACLDRIERLNDGLRAFISVYPDLALADARAAEAAVMAGDDLGPLHGVPLAIKDLFAVRGMARTCGSRLIAEGPGTADAESVAALRTAGGIVVGLANLHEFAFGPTGINPHFGTAKNPWDRSKVCGGSSSGSGCAVAAGLVPGAMGTDTGGSVRIPAALCGIVGLKPTHLRVSQQGIYPLAGEFDTGGPMTRSVADTALMMQALDPEGGFAGHRARPSLEGIRIGVAEALFDSAVDPDIDRHCRAAIAVLEALGAETERLDLPFADDAVAAWTTISLGRVYALHGARADAAYTKLSPSVRERVLTGRDISSADVDKALTIQQAVQAQVSDLMQRFDAFVLPTTPIPAVDANDGQGILDGAPVDGTAALGRLARMASFTGQPAVSVPSGLTSGGLPAGLQLIGDWDADAKLLEIAACYEAAGGWAGRRPPMADAEEKRAG
ncbi:MAG: amidase [Rhodospirillaceae bacterium]|nr:amidase [Rhodospirillaceae bacterium]MYH36034.1 amidase [Rhodospirillaceae bacterium]MYK14844.1 amidase [Rhodospirillaceae bacterium]